MTMMPVSSSNISAVGYDGQTRTLTIEFKSGGRHAYADVPAELHKAMMAAESVGKFFHANIKSAFQSSRVEEDAA